MHLVCLLGCNFYFVSWLCNIGVYAGYLLIDMELFCFLCFVTLAILSQKKKKELSVEEVSGGDMSQ
jgi:hypothetical protein